VGVGNGRPRVSCGVHGNGEHLKDVLQVEIVVSSRKGGRKERKRLPGGGGGGGGGAPPLTHALRLEKKRFQWQRSKQLKSQKTTTRRENITSRKSNDVTEATWEVLFNHEELKTCEITPDVSYKGVNQSGKNRQKNIAKAESPLRLKRTLQGRLDPLHRSRQKGAPL